MIQKSLNRINSKIISNKTLKKTITIHFCSKFSEIEKILTTANYSFLKQLNFNFNYGNYVILPDINGKISSVIFGMKKTRKVSKFLIGSQLSKLPKNNYLIKNYPKNENTFELILGFYLSFYSFKEYHKKSKSLKKPTLNLPNSKKKNKILYFAESEYVVRDLINLPANILNPNYFEEYVKKFSNFHNTKLKIVCGKSLKKDFPLIHEVGKASSNKPRLFELTYKRSNSSLNLTLIGKGVCFDTGGLNLKSGFGMMNMKKDMSGAASVLGLAHYLIRLNLNLNLRILIPCVENSLSEKSFRPGDILISRSGMGIEVKNTESKIKRYVPLSKRQDKPDSALWLIKHHSILKDSQISRLVGITKNSVSSIRNKSYWNYNNLNSKDPVAMGLFSQKDLLLAIEKAERRIQREKKDKEKSLLVNKI